MGKRRGGRQYRWAYIEAEGLFSGKVTLEGTETRGGRVYTIVGGEGTTAVTLRERGKGRLTMGDRLSILTAVCIGG